MTYFNRIHVLNSVQNGDIRPLNVKSAQFLSYGDYWHYLIFGKVYSNTEWPNAFYYLVNVLVITLYDLTNVIDYKRIKNEFLLLEQMDDCCDLIEVF